MRVSKKASKNLEYFKEMVKVLTGQEIVIVDENGKPVKIQNKPRTKTKKRRVN